MPDILIVGVGNALRSDDGVGARVVAALRSLDLPRDVEVLESGTASILLHTIADRRKVIAVDAVQGGGSPGSVYRLSAEDLEAGHQSATSVHQVGLVEALALAKALGCAPRQVVIIGIEPKAVDWGLDLSPEVAEAVPAVVQMVIQETYRE